MSEVFHEPGYMNTERQLVGEQAKAGIPSCLPRVHLIRLPQFDPFSWFNPENGKFLVTKQRPLVYREYMLDIEKVNWWQRVGRPDAYVAFHSPNYLDIRWFKLSDEVLAKSRLIDVDDPERQFQKRPTWMIPAARMNPSWVALEDALV